MKLGEVRPQPLLNSFVQDRSREAGQIEALRRWIGQPDLAEPTVFVTHQVVVTALSQILPGNGEIVVMQRLGTAFSVRGRVPTACRTADLPPSDEGCYEPATPPVADT